MKAGNKGNNVTVEFKLKLLSKLQSVWAANNLEFPDSIIDWSTVERLKKFLQQNEFTEYDMVELMGRVGVMELLFIQPKKFSTRKSIKLTKKENEPYKKLHEFLLDPSSIESIEVKTKGQKPFKFRREKDPSIFSTLGYMLDVYKRAGGPKVDMISRIAQAEPLVKKADDSFTIFYVYKFIREKVFSSKANNEYTTSDTHVRFLVHCIFEELGAIPSLSPDKSDPNFKERRSAAILKHLPKPFLS